MDIFITGASGYVGSHLTRRLIDEGHRVHALARSSRARERVEELGATARAGSLAELDVLEAAARDADAVVHAAVDYADPAMADTELPALRALLSGARGKPFVYVSTGLVYPNSPAPLTESTELGAETAAQPFKLLGERAVLGAGGTVVRPALVHGHGGSALLVGLFAAARERGVVPYVGDGAQRWSTVHVDDVARLVSALLERPAPGEAFNAAAPQPVAIADLAGAIAEHAGATPIALTLEQALQVNPAIALLGRTAVLDPAKAQDLRGWSAEGPALLDDLGSVAYRELAAAAA
ncbi:NAD-dependent epimerase/dehydratase family protein [Agromyces sp. MMS24-JH15]|uniref:NAD-dependent epimerase/dehydratase family protein n=1 Tax=Agromyces sp. MMS24-JH15 TaxID=3243765 RepID=UPI0037493259